MLGKYSNIYLQVTQNETIFRFDITNITKLVLNNSTSNVYVFILFATRGGPCQHGLMCGCNFVSIEEIIGHYRPT